LRGWRKARKARKAGGQIAATSFIKPRILLRTQYPARIENRTMSISIQSASSMLRVPRRRRLRDSPSGRRFEASDPRSGRLPRRFSDYTTAQTPDGFLQNDWIWSDSLGLTRIDPMVQINLALSRPPMFSDKRSPRQSTHYPLPRLKSTRGGRIRLDWVGSTAINPTKLIASSPHAFALQLPEASVRRRIRAPSVGFTLIGSDYPH
jgi:hypothetical protein